MSEVEAIRIYEVIGDLYKRMHAVKHARDGLWLGNPEHVHIGMTCTEYMYNAEIVGGSGKRAIEVGRISQHTYERAVTLWADNLILLEAHQPAMVHNSAFPWTIYLEQCRGEWCVTKLMALDCFWWDPVWDIACLRYPPFGKITPACWEAFLRSYGPEPERKRILLYAVMVRLMAVMGTFIEPTPESDKAWAEHSLLDMDAFLDEIEQSG